VNVIEKLRSLVEDIRKRPAPAMAKGEWELAVRLLGRMPVDQGEVKRVAAAWDLAGLDALVSQVEGKAAPAAEPAVASEAPAVSQDDMDHALRAFRKRLKLMRLSDESKLGGGRHTSTGRKSEIDAILPPHEIPAEVWKALARAGKLKDEGGGFYSLPA
jgi:hypothetical protein